MSEEITLRNSVPGANGGTLTPFRPGQSGNPKGRPPAGLSLREKCNDFVSQGLTAKQLRVIARDESAPIADRGAANRLLRLAESPDLSDFEPFFKGDKSLSELRDAGINTEVVKKRKSKTRQVQVGDGVFETEIEREIELYDRGRDEFKLVADQTAGQTDAPINVQGDLNITEIKVIVPGLPRLP